MTNEAKTVDFNYLEAVPLLTRQVKNINVVQVGVGGTGSWLVPHVARLVRELEKNAGKKVAYRLIDPDVVEEKNCIRQNFCDAEVGLPKASTLALRYSSAWGIEIRPIVERFSSEKLASSIAHGRADTMTVVIGCVDNSAARRELAGVLQLNNTTNTISSITNNRRSIPSVFWLDCGNWREGGQVVLGSAFTPQDLKEAFANPAICTALPSPVLQHPDLLEPLPEEQAETTLSCAELAMANAQSMTVNSQVATIAVDYLLRLLLVGGLKRFATYFHLPTGTMRSTYITPSEVGRVIGRQPASFFTGMKAEAVAVSGAKAKKKVKVKVKGKEGNSNAHKAVVGSGV